MKIAVIGAGASGLTCAIVIKRLGHAAVVFEKNSRAAKKLLATGNGRCNLTNVNMDLSYYHGDTGFASYALSSFNQYDVMNFMESLGVVPVIEEDRIYPYSFQASSVVDMLRLGAEGMEKCEEEVIKLTPLKNEFQIHTKKDIYKFDKVIVCCGGKAAPRLSGGGSYELLTKLGHSMTELKPAIVQLKAKGTKAMDGIKVNALVKMGDKTEKGEVLFTSYGLSGPPILQLSRDAVGKAIELDLAPDLDFGRICDILNNKKIFPELTLENLFTGFLNKKVGREILRFADIMPFSREAKSLSDKEIKKLASLVKCLPFEIEGTMGFDNAQVTAGGIKCSEFDDKTMESKLHKGLYAAGEVLDVDGDCGGYNLQWAFSSAHLAALSACREAENDKT
ncbi:MAG: NAD(P)/FAD-dependent oxidoreductase [Bacillota bacterium]|nr:NAD(P)/FAD-dependent oxidoreductase [Bacillota bacterium]